jgi:hypothetical protein
MIVIFSYITLNFESVALLSGMPTLLSLEVTGDAIEGTTMFASKRYWGGEEGDTMFRWILVGCCY